MQWFACAVHSDMPKSRTDPYRGEVEVFHLICHPKAKRAYAWSHREGQNDEGERFVAVLEIAPVDSAQKAVRIQIVKDVRAKR